MSTEQRIEWIGVYRQYRRGGHPRGYAALMATNIACLGIPF